jgi:uncharacterized membrane protein
MIYHWNAFITIGLVLFLYGLVTLIFPPKFGNDMFGICTKMTMLNKEIWKHGQKLLAYTLMSFGLINAIIGLIRNKYQVDYWIGVLLLIAFWQLTKFIINKILTKKYPDTAYTFE